MLVGGMVRAECSYLGHRNKGSGDGGGVVYVKGVQVFQYLCSIKGHVQEWQEQDRIHKYRLFHEQPFLSCKMFLLVGCF